MNTSLKGPPATPLAPDFESALQQDRLEALSPRERIVLGNLSEHITLDELATRLWVSRNTVKSQVRSVYRKIGVSTRAEAAAWAQAAGLLED